MNKILLFLILLTAVNVFAEDVVQRPVGALDLTEADVDQLEKSLASDSGRLPAIARLAEFASVELYSVGSVIFVDSDAKRGALRKRAAKIVLQQEDIATVSRALDSDDVRLQFWGVKSYSAGLYRAMTAAGRNPLQMPAEGRTEEEQAWSALTPKVRNLVKTGHDRWSAISVLDRSDGDNQAMFLSRIPVETSPDVLLILCENTTMRSYDHPGNETRDARLNQELLRLLASPDTKIRNAALGFVGFNYNSAPMWQVRFSPAVISRAAEFQFSTDAEEKRMAGFAADGLKKLKAMQKEE